MLEALVSTNEGVDAEELGKGVADHLKRPVHEPVLCSGKDPQLVLGGEDEKSGAVSEIGDQEVGGEVMIVEVKIESRGVLRTCCLSCSVRAALEKGWVGEDGARVLGPHLTDGRLHHLPR